MKTGFCIRYRRLIVVATAFGAASGCREGVTYTPVPDRDDLGTPDVVHLTHNVGLDQNPVWSRNSDTVYYSSAGFYDTPGNATVLLSLSRAGGIAHTILPENLRRNERQAAPALSPDGQQVAYIELAGVLTPATCRRQVDPAGPFANEPCFTPEPILDSAIVRVRSRSDGGSTDRASFSFRVPGPDPKRHLGGVDTYSHTFFPFQDEFYLDNIIAFRPAWSPDGTRIAFSDGIQIYIWNYAAGGAPALVPNTVDGVTPAWSPDGARIAFTRLLRTDSLIDGCSCTNDPAPDAHTVWGQTNIRWYKRIGNRVVNSIRTDGTATIVIGDGEEPTWSPDGSTLYFRSNRAIYSAPASGGGTLTLVENTSNGYAPAVSPDGKWLAFSRRPTVGSKELDVWVIRIGAPQAP